MQYVYLLKDGNGNVVDVGESKDPIQRLIKKTKRKPAAGQGQFYGRTDITQEIVASYPTRKLARIEETRLKIYYGLETTEINRQNRVLTLEQAEEIRAKYIPYKYHQYMLAKEYGVNRTVIQRILNNKNYLDL